MMKRKDDFIELKKNRTWREINPLKVSPSTTKKLLVFHTNQSQ